MTKKLTAKQQRFVDEYLIDCNGKQAAIRAGYSEKTADQQASRLLRNVKVSAVLAGAQEKMAERFEITRGDIVDELAKLGFSNMQDYMTVTEKGDAFVDLSALTRDQAAAISEITSEVYLEGKGDGAKSVKRTKLKISDKRGALVDLGKHLGMFKEQVEHSGPDGGPIEVSDVESARRIAFALTRGDRERVH